MSFESNLARGRLGERLVSGWCQGRGWYVIPSYDFSGSEGDKAPRMQGARGSLVIPDLDVARLGKRLWLEVKTYAHAAENRALGETVHGIKRRHYEDYQRVARESGTVVHLGVLEIDSGALLIGDLGKLRAHPCMCRGCKSEQPWNCAAPVKESVYFVRRDFVPAHFFSDSEMAELRRAAA